MLQASAYPTAHLQANLPQAGAPLSVSDLFGALVGAEKAEQAGMVAQVGSPANVEAVSAFIERRKPDFRKLIDPV